MIAADDSGICGFLLLTCSRLDSCKGADDHCEKPDHICVHHPRCQDHPVCYPLPMIDQRICPPPNKIPINDTTTTSTTIETTITTPIETTMTTTIQTTTTSPSSRPEDGICATATWARNGITVAGNITFGNELNRLYSPVGIFMDENETMYIVDRGNHRVMKWKKGALSGEVVAGIAGRGGNSSQLYNPVDVVVDTDGTMYVADANNNRIQKYLQGAYRGETILSIQSPSGVALDGEGTLYVSGTWYVSSVLRGFLYKRNKGENNWQSIGNNATILQYLTVDRNLSVVGVNTDYKQIIIKYKDNKTLYYIADGTKEVFFNPMFEPYSAILDQSGVIYIVERSNHRVTRWVPNAPTGTIIIGGGAAASSPNGLNNPSDLTFDHEGNLYIVDTNNNRVQKFAIDKSSCQ